MQHLKTKKIAIFLTLLVLLAISSFIFFFNDELESTHISSQLPYHPEWEISHLTEEESAKIDQILEQPFVYLGQGGQSYAFASADQEYVLKLFKFKRFRPAFFIHAIPNIFPFKTYRERHIAKREQKLFTAFNGHKLAYDLHRKDSGLIFIQLNPSELKKQIQVIDKKGHQRIINLNKVSFVIQKRGQTLSYDLSTLLDQGNVQLAKQRIDQLFDLYLLEYSKGIYDLDHGVMHNIGSANGQLFHLDVGKLTYDENIKNFEFYAKDLIKVASKLSSWVDRQYPAYAKELKGHIWEKFYSIIFKKTVISLINKNINID